MAVAAAHEIVGRDVELTTIRAFLRAPGMRALVLDGEAGIGKTTLWHAAVEVARERGDRVLSCGAVEAEAQLSLSALADLLGEVPRDAATVLPEIQQHALEVALAEREPAGEGLDGHILGAALLNLLRALAEERPLLVAVDDLQWLDPSSAAIVLYAVRRLREGRVKLLATCRGEPGAPLPFDCERACGTEMLRLSVGPLSEGALHRLLHQRLDSSLPRTLLHAVHETSGGNPFYALELARAGIELEPDGTLQLPRSLELLVQERLSQLPPATRDLLLHAAALAEPRLDLLAQLGEGESLEPALAAGVLEGQGDRFRFSHPLLAGAVWSSASPRRRREVHRTLAAAVADPEQRARHLALATEQPDLEVAEALEQAALRARERGATAAAADLFEQAARLTSVDEGDRWARLIAAAITAQRETGDWQRPSRLLDQALERLPPGSSRSEVLIAFCAMHPGAVALARQAVAEAEDDETRVRALMALASQHAFRGEWAEELNVATDAHALAERLGSPDLVGATLCWLGAGRVDCGDMRGRDDLERALEIEQRVGALPVGNPDTAPGSMLPAIGIWCSDAWSEALAAYEERLRRLRERGDELSYWWVAVDLVAVELERGDWSRAREILDECGELIELGDESRWFQHVQGGMLALAGDLGAARSLIMQELHSNESAGDRFGESQCHAWLTLVELCDGNPERSLEYAALRHDFVGEGLEVARGPRIEMNELEALVLTGRHEEALRLVGRLRAVGEQQGRPRFLAVAEWGEGLLRSERGDLDGARTAFERALARHEDLCFPLDRGRIRLGYGQLLRRSKQRRAAREQLGRALRELEALGAGHFARKAREELARVGGRAPVAEGALTPTEDRVARLVSEGLSNKEVAARLFVTVRTVEATLTRVYAKLGVRSRAQLARALADGPEEG